MAAERVARTRYLVIGVIAFLAIVGIYIGSLTLSEGFAHVTRQLASAWYWVLLTAGGFGIQVGLFFFTRAAMRRRGRAATASTTASGGLSAGSMVACCAHHVTDVVPFLGLASAATFLAERQVFLFGVAIVSNVLGVTILLDTVQRHGLSRRLANRRINLSLAKKAVILAALPVLAVIFVATS